MAYPDRITLVWRKGATVDAGSTSLPVGREPMRWPRGDAGRVRFKLVDENGDAVPLTGRQLVLTLAKPVAGSSTPKPVIRPHTVEDEAGGLGYFQIESVDTSGLSATVEYRWDIRIRDTDGRPYQVLLSGSWQVLEAYLEDDDVPTTPLSPVGSGGITSVGHEATADGTSVFAARLDHRHQLDQVLGLDDSDDNQHPGYFRHAHVAADEFGRVAAIEQGETVTRIGGGAIEAGAAYKVGTSGRMVQLETGDGINRVRGIAATACAGDGQDFEGWELGDVDVTLLSDGTTAIAAGDIVEPGNAGRFRKASDQTTAVGYFALEAAAAVNGTTFRAT